MRNQVVGVLAAAVVLGMQSGARAQTAATVQEVMRVVKTAKGGAAELKDAKIGGPLTIGDRVRTGGRSGAGLKFQDQSVLRMSELTEVVVTSPRQRETRVTRGKVFADYKTPGVISGGYAVAAVRGTHVYYEQDDDNHVALVRCYKGRVFVSSSANPVSAGTAAMVTPTSLLDPGLRDTTTDWSSGEIRFVDGPYVGQTRRITGYDRAEGTVTFAPPLTAPAGGAAGITGYLLAAKPGGDVVELRDNQGTTVHQNQSPEKPYNVPGEEFARLQRYPFFQERQRLLLTYVGSRDHFIDRDENFGGRDAIRLMDPPLFRPCDCGGTPLPPGGQRGGLFRVRSTSFAPGAGDTQGSGASPRLDDVFFPANVKPTRAEGEHDNAALLFEPYAFGSDNGDSAFGGRLRFQGVSGNVYAELGYRYARINEQRDLSDISEGLLHVRGKYGDIIAGRQHLFMGPANNSDVGELLGLDATDAVVYDLPLKKGYQQRFGYVFDSRALQVGGYHGGFLRGQAPVNGGYVGYSVLATTREGNNIGWSVDGSQPLVKNVLDIYGEAGVDHVSRSVYLAGLYVPWLYHKTGLDLFTEYSHREGVTERLNFRLRKELGSGFVALLFADKEFGGGWVTGGGALWSLKIR